MDLSTEKNNSNNPGDRENHLEESAKSIVRKTIKRVTRSIGFKCHGYRMRSAKSASVRNQSARPTTGQMRVGMVASSHWISAAKEELTNVTTLNLITKTSSILEKILWGMIAICGTIFIYHVVDIQLQNWRDNPILSTKITKKLADMPLPAVTFCHKGLHKYGLVEHLGNYIDPEKKVPKEVVAIRNEFLKVEFLKIKDRMNGKNFCEWLFDLQNDEKDDNPIISHIKSDDRDALKAKCIVG